MLDVRHYQPTDQAAVWRLHNVALAAVGTHAGNGLWDNDLYAIEEVYVNNGGVFLVGVYDEHLVAMGALKRTTHERAEVKRMRVDPAFQQRGFGHIMLTVLEHHARRLGYRYLYLDTTVQQRAAQRLYEKNGYVEVRRAHVLGMETLFYEKTLTD